MPTLEPTATATATWTPEPTPTVAPTPKPTATATSRPTASPTSQGNGLDSLPEPPGLPSGLLLPFRVEDVGGGNGFISPFGIIRHSRDQGHGHGEIDVPLKMEAPIYAVANGTILSVEESTDGAGSSNVTRLLSGSSGEGWAFLYEHVTLEPGLAESSVVSRSELIARNGLTSDRRNSHFQLTYLFKDYRFSREHRCWVDYLDTVSKEASWAISMP